MKLSKSCALLGAVSFLAAPNLFAAVVGSGSLFISAAGFPPDQAGPYQVSSIVVSTGPNPGSSFNTFCLGTKVDYSPNTTYGYQISDTVQPPQVGPPAVVTWGTAWLYSQYRAGNIGSGSANNVVNDALQEAIWTLQGQSFSSGITLSSDSVNHPGTLLSDRLAFLSAATTAATAHGIGNDLSDAKGAFGVYALDMFTGSSSSPNYVQPQLVIVPEASTALAGALLLLPFGLSYLRKDKTS